MVHAVLPSSVLPPLRRCRAFYCPTAKQEDLLARAADVGGQLRETTEELEVLKAEVLALRESIRFETVNACF